MKSNKPSRPFITVKEALVAVLVIILFSVAFEKPFPIVERHPPPVRQISDQDASEFIQQIKSISAGEIDSKIKSTDDKPTIMVIHASWCGYCKKLLRNIATLKKEGSIDNTEILIVSVDEDKMKLSKYLLQYNYDKVFTPYIMDSTEETKLKSMIINKGGAYSKSIPYSVIFDKNGKMAEEVRGVMSGESILRKLNGAIQGHNG
jgi:thioredoxin-related protein